MNILCYGSFDVFACLIWLQVHRFTVEATFHVSTTSREGLHPLSFICSGSEPFRPEEQLLSTEGEIFLLTNMTTLLGNRYMYQLIWSSSVLQLLSESRLHLELSLVRSTIWLSELWFETSRSVYIGIILTSYALFYSQSISFYPDLVFFRLYLSFSLCFEFLQGTELMQLARSGATAWT